MKQPIEVTQLLMGPHPAYWHVLFFQKTFLSWPTRKLTSISPHHPPTPTSPCLAARLVPCRHYRSLRYSALTALPISPIPATQPLPRLLLRLRRRRLARTRPTRDAPERACASPRAPSKSGRRRSGFLARPRPLRDS